MKGLFPIACSARCTTGLSRTVSLTLLSSGALLLLTTKPVSALPALEAVALSGTQAPGQPSGVLYADFYSSLDTNYGIPGPSLGNGGQVAFYGRLFGNGITPATQNGIGIWEGAPGNVSLLIQGGMTPPGTGPGSTFFFNPNGPPGTPPPIDAAGNVAIHTETLPALTDGLWLGQPNNVTLLALSQTQAPSEPAGIDWAGFTSPLMTSSGEIAFGAGLAPSGQFVSSTLAIYSGTPGNFAQVAISGGPAPGTSTVFSSAGPTQPLTPTGVNTGGQVVFLGLTLGVNPYGVWSGAPGPGRTVSSQRCAPSGYRNGRDVRRANPDCVQIHPARHQHAGQSIFAAAISGTPLPYQPAGIWAGTPGTLGLVAKTGDPAVGLSSGVTWSDIYDPVPGGAIASPLLNAQGHVLFQAQTAPSPSGPSQPGDFGWGLWTGLPGHLSLVAHVGLPDAG